MSSAFHSQSKASASRWFSVTERFIRAGTRGSSSWPGDQSPTRGRIHLRRLHLRPHQSPLAVRRRTIHFANYRGRGGLRLTPTGIDDTKDVIFARALLDNGSSNGAGTIEGPIMATELPRTNVLDRFWSVSSLISVHVPRPATGQSSISES